MAGTGGGPGAGRVPGGDAASADPLRGAPPGPGGWAPPLMSRPAFLRRVFSFTAFALGGLALSLAAGVAGYHWLAGLGWADAVFNAAMILSGMGPVSPMPTVPAKLFASAYAVVGSMVWTALLGIVLYPFIHRMLHALHLEIQGADDD